ncbi:hypothetical protein GCM10027029_29670 [Conyzicola lurida]
MRATAMMLFALLVGALLVPVAAGPASAAASDIETILAATNKARVNAGLKPLVHNTAMDAVSQAWAKQMSAAHKMYHNPSYSKQIPAGWTMAAENVAWNYSSSSVVAAWLNSPGHRKNIMSTATDIGIGYYKDAGGDIWLVQNFARYATPTAPIAAAVPKISGVATVGATLTANAGAWTPAPTFSYQWKRGTTVIAGAKSKTYVPTAADIGSRISVTVTGSKTGYAPASRASAATSIVTGTFTTAGIPAISGTAKVGNVLKVSLGTWKPALASASYQWRANGAAIAGATKSTYTVTPITVDKVITVAVTGSRPNYVSMAKASGTTKAVTGLVYKNCDALNAAYPHGVAKVGTRFDRVSGVNKAFKGTPFFSNSLYALNPNRDADKDGIACEK